MTVGSRVKETLAGLKSAQATLNVYSIQSQSGEAKTVFEETSATIGEIINGMEERLKVIELEEPQYKGF